MNTNENNVCAGTEITVIGRGTSSALPDMITISFVSSIDAVKMQQISQKIKEHRETVTKALMSWAHEEDIIDVNMYTISAKTVRDHPLVKMRISVTTKRLDEIADLIRIGEEHAFVEYNKTYFTLSDARQKEEESIALQMAMDDAENSIKATAAKLNVKVLYVNHIDISHIDKSKAPSSICTFDDGGMDLTMSSVITGMEVKISYLVGNE